MPVPKGSRLRIPSAEAPPAGRQSATPRATMRDVAQAAGVSVQTVSNLINGKTNHMGADTEARLREVSETLKFRPNSSAQGLRSKSTRVLAFVIGDASEAFLGDPMTDLFLAGLGSELRSHDYSLLIDSYRPGDPLRNITRQLDDGRVDGAVVMLSGPIEERTRAAKQLRRSGRPLILLQEHSHLADGLPSVSAQDCEGSYRLSTHLVEKGHRRITFLTAKEDWSALEQRAAGYTQALTEAGLKSHLKVLHANDFSPTSGAEAATRILSRQSRPTAIMCGNDRLALGVLRAASKLGLKVPEELAVTGFNDFDFAAMTSPSLSTVRIPGYEMGVAAATSLLGFANHKTSIPSSLYEVELRLRESTGD